MTPPRIFVAIAAYRDPECQWTVKDLFEAAAQPERVTVGICWQYDPAADQACFQVPSPRPEQTLSLHVHHSHSRGACWAKSQALSLRGTEDYVLLIDSHMRFAPGWDDAMIATLQETGDARAFLSTYPAGYEPPNQRRFSTPRLAPVKFFGRIMSMNSVLLDMPRPMPSYLVAGGYVFGQGAMFDQVPYDPHIYFIGEEITHAARYFTHGWNGYTPHRCLIHHYYTRQETARHWGDQKDSWARINSASYSRVRHLLGIERTRKPEALVDIDRYGMGTVRDLDEFQARIGVNFKGQVIDRAHYETLAANEHFLAHPQPPARALDTGVLTLCLCRSGYLLVPQLDSYIGKSLREYGEWCEGLNPLLAERVPAGGCVVEVGAGFGSRSIVLSRLVGEGGRLVCIEQSRRHVEVLHGNVALNTCENIRIVQARAASRTGLCRVREPDFSVENNHGLVAATPDAPGADTPLMPLDTLDIGAPDLLLVDAPGSAAEVLAGAPALLERRALTLIVNVDNTADADAVQDFARRTGRPLQIETVPFFNPGNYHRKADNLFGGLRSSFAVLTG